MRRLLFVCLLVCVGVVPSFGQIFRNSPTKGSLYWKNRKPDAAYWQQDVHYNIVAKINEEEHRIDGAESLSYTNNSPDTLDVVYFHLYQNAFIKGSYLHKLEEEKGQKPVLGKHEAAGEGTIIEHIEVDGKRALVTLDNTILQVKLHTPLKPGEKVLITMGFKTWYDRGTTRRRMAMYDAWGSMHYNGVQWYPKMCVYDRKFGWDTYQHLNKEFYGDFGTFDVTLDFPSNYVVEATGELMNRSTVLPDALRKQLDIKNFATKKWGESPSIITPYVKGERKMWKYHAEGVHDFAFTADPSYRIGSTTWNGIECVAIAQEPHASGWQNGAEYVAKIIKTFSETIGPYGYPKMVAADANDGMEYPMLTLDGGSDPGYHGLLVHEIGHNWFYGMVGSNETYRASMDEGFTQFLTAWGLRKIDGDTMISTPAKNKWVRNHSEPVITLDRNVLNTYTIDALNRNELPLNTHSNDFHDALGHEGGYRQVYYKTASMLYNLEYVLGDSLFQQAMHHYFMQWRFAHPYFEDFRASIIQFTHVDLNWFFDQWIETTKTIDYSIKSVTRRNSADVWNITFERKGEMQMPIDFTVTAKDGTQKSYTISNTWFQKNDKTTPIEGKWWGWGKIQPRYTAQVSVPSGIKYVQIDTSYRLADVDWTNNYYTRPFFARDPGMITKFDAGITLPTDRRHYRLYWRPDLWYNGLDGVKAGLHIEGDYLGVLNKVDATVWWNTHLLQHDQYKPASGDGMYRRYRPLSYTINLSSPISKKVPKLNGDLHLRDLDGLQYFRVGAAYATSDNSNVQLHWMGMMRRDASDFDYLLHPQEWSSTRERPNSSLNLDYNSYYSYPKGAGAAHILLRAPFLTGNEGNAFDYSFLQAELINTHRLGKLYLRTRLFARYGMGTSLPYESALFAGGANPEELMENKYTRSVGFVPNEWRGVSRYEPTHFQMGGGLNLRGYTGYFMPDERDGELLIGYKGRSGAAVNAELDFDQLIRLRPKITRNWLSIDAYLFVDAGIMELSRYSTSDFTSIAPTEMWSDVHVDAGPGFAFNIKKFGPFDKARPLTIRVDLPVYLNRTPFGNPQYAGFRYVVGVNRTF